MEFAIFPPLGYNRGKGSARPRRPEGGRTGRAKEVLTMRDGFIKVAAGTPKLRVADCRYNAEQIFTLMREADKQG